ncbi:hypothetical protein SH1V18_01170 [Vallitalea longa]|uniref:Uncharacterized protein n=1 Tax=Vallitalea longa TaxID=2936439 RepID=A0A9W5Y734_9FIRM|nr:hypothetical protein [Vallitalea longa]GKX27637.1 hypothetical protein SH1V18_01170 [Vallitalea longa]
MLDIQNYLDDISNIQLNIQEIHMLYKINYPIVIVKDDNCYIFDKSNGTNYSFIKEFKAVMHIPDDIAACFYLDNYYKKYCCIIGYKLIFEKNFPIVCFHEMVHCYQGMTVEEDIKNKLKIYDENSPMWEINYKFKYNEENFINYFKDYINALNNEKLETVKVKRKLLLQHLNECDREYFIWQEWKEGFARFIENKVRKKVGYDENNSGQESPYSRISFYRSGDLYTNQLYEYNFETMNIEELYVKLNEF